MSTQLASVQEGDALDETLDNITVTDIVRYAGASGDFNPLHHDVNVAQAAGVEGVFVMGMFQAGAVGVRIAEWLGPENCRRFHVRFRERCWPGDDLKLSARVVRVYEEDGEQRADVDLAVTRQTGSLALTGTAAFAIQ